MIIISVFRQVIYSGGSHINVNNVNYTFLCKLYIFNSFSPMDCGCQKPILTSKVDPRAERNQWNTLAVSVEQGFT